MVRSSRAHRLSVLVLLAWATGGCQTGTERRDAAGASRLPVAEPARTVEDPPLADPVTRILPVRVATGVAARGLQSETRRLSQPIPWDGELELPFELAADRDEARSRSLAHRAKRRAFEGAPPVMPHGPSFGNGASCVDCHTHGFDVDEDLVGRAMSHPPLASCMQCHIEAENLDLPRGGSLGNAFSGQRPSAAPSARSSGGAPPPIPHRIEMRGRCLSCHGELGYPGLRTSHPERALCMQCHVLAGSP